MKSLPKILIIAAAFGAFGYGVGVFYSMSPPIMAGAMAGLTLLYGFLLTKRILICDRDDKFTEQFKKTIEARGVEVVVTPYQAPNCNAYAERLVRSIKDECLHRMILFGERNLLRCLRGYTAHYHAERNHQGIGNELMARLVEESERNGIWSLYSSIFPENQATLKLHLGHGFREVGIRERIAQRNGRWRNTLILERRSKKVGV